MRVPSLKPVMMEMVLSILQRERDHTRQLVESVIDAEQNYLFINDADYKQKHTSLVPQRQILAMSA